MSDDNNNIVGQIILYYLKRWGKYAPIVLVAAFLITWLTVHLCASVGSKVEVWGIIKYEKAGSKKIEEQIGYVPRSAVASEDGVEFSPGVKVTLRKGGSRLRHSPSLDSPGPFLDEETEAYVILLEDSWVKIRLKPQG